MLSSKEIQQLAYWTHSCRVGQRWNKEVALEYWLQPAALSQGVGAFSDGVFGATNNGWLNTGTILGVAGAAADFPAAAENTWALASDKGTPGVFAIDTAGDVLNSPALFGDPTHMQIAAALIDMEDLPSKLIYETFGTNFAVVSNNETASGHGFVEDGGSAAVANDHLACFVSDGTSFKLRSGAATSAALMAADTNPHRWKAVIDRIAQLAYAFIDDMATPLGSIAIEADEFPVSVGAGVLTSTGANFINWGPVRVRYAWYGWS